MSAFLLNRIVIIVQYENLDQQQDQNETNGLWATRTIQLVQKVIFVPKLYIMTNCKQRV